MREVKRRGWGKAAHHYRKINRKEGKWREKEEKEEKERKEGKREGNMYYSSLSEQRYAFSWNIVCVVNENPFIFLNIKL